MHRPNLTGVTLGPGCPPIHSLLFADYLILYGQATTQEAATIRSILQHFCNASGQTPNLQKSVLLFSKNVPADIRDSIKNIFPVPGL